MAVRIRMKRMGAKKRPFYRLMVSDSRRHVSKGAIEQIGTYNPTEEGEEALKIDEELALKWLHNGAQPSDSVHKLLSRKGIMEKFHNEKTTNLTNKG